MLNVVLKKGTILRKAPKERSMKGASSSLFRNDEEEANK